MTVNAVTSANGRIRKIFIFDTKQYVLAEGATNEERFAPLLEKYADMADDLNAFHPEYPVEFCLFFRMNPHGPRYPEWLDEIRHIRFIPVNHDDRTCSVSTDWAQDRLNIPSENMLLVDKRYFDAGMNDLLKKHSGAIQFGFFHRPCDGGNLLRGKHNTQYEYIIKSWFREGTCTEDELHRQTGVKKRNILNVVKNNDPVTDACALFHADLYCTIVGDTGNKEELVLIAEPYLENQWEGLNTALQDFRGRLDGITTDMPTKFRVLPLPLVVLNDNTGKMTHVFSYNNCLVENYLDEQQVRHIHFYFPDFLYELQNTKENTRIREEALALMNAMPEPLMAFAALPADPHDPNSFGTLQIRTVQDEIQKRIDNHFSTLPNIRYQVKFVRHDFKSLSKRHGALHCITKVIERDRL